jgi:hypothetical protein
MLSIDDFENTDGRVRFISAIEKSTEFKNEDRVFLLTKTLRIGSRLTEENRIHLGEILLKFYSEPKLRFEIAEALRTELAQAAVLSDFNSRLRNINKNLIK